MLTWTIIIPGKKKKQYREAEFLLDENGIFVKWDNCIGDPSFMTALLNARTGRQLKKDRLVSPGGRCAILWRKVSSVEEDDGTILVRGNAESEIEIVPAPETYDQTLAYIEEMRKTHPMVIEADDEAARWFCFGLDEDWEAETPLSAMIEEEIRTAHERCIEEDSLEATVIPQE